MVLIPTFRTDNPVLFPYGAKFPLARGFIWIPIGKFYQFHALYVLTKGIDYTSSIKDSKLGFLRIFIKLNYTIKSRHTLSLLYAPLETKSEGSVTNDIFFEGVVFPANTELVGIYKFNSYRFTYRYDIVKKTKFEFGLGLTAKIRDAKIALSSPGLNSEKTNIGFVPIINFRLLWKVDDKFGLLLDGDALAAPQGRAEDVLIAATYKLSDNFGIRAGYRILEGGADNDEVYNFALFHYASVGLSINF